MGLWTFDGKDLTDKVYDRSGQGNDGYFIGGATSTAKTIGKMGQGLQLDGSNDFVRSINSIGISGDAVFSVAGWFYFRSSSSVGVLTYLAGLARPASTGDFGGPTCCRQNTQAVMVRT